jgi:hypothetical protein
MMLRWIYWIIAILTALMWAAVLIAPGGEAG